MAEGAPDGGAVGGGEPEPARSPLADHPPADDRRDAPAPESADQPGPPTGAGPGPGRGRRAGVSEADPRWELVYGEALRALTYQQSALDNLRSRATLLTAGAALVSSALGTPALQDQRWGAAAVVAIGALGLVLAAAGVICAPWWRWRFVASAARLTEAVELGHSIDSMRRRLAADFEHWLDDNERRLRLLQWCFTAGLGALLLEMMAWLVQIAQLKG